MQQLVNPVLISVYIQIVLGLLITRIKDWIISIDKFKEKWGKLVEAIQEKLTMQLIKRSSYFYENYLNFSEFKENYYNEYLENVKKELQLVNYLNRINWLRKHINLLHQFLFYTTLLGFLYIIVYILFLLFNITGNYLFFLSVPTIICQMIFALFIFRFDKNFNNIEEKIYYE